MLPAVFFGASVQDDPVQPDPSGSSGQLIGIIIGFALAIGATFAPSPQVRFLCFVFCSIVFEYYI